MEIIYLKIGLAIIFSLAVIAKLTGKTKSTFEKSGFGPKFMYATATGEFIFTILLFTKLEILATLGLLAIINGAIFTLFRQKAKPQKYALAVVAAFLLLVLLIFLLVKQ